MPTKKLSLDFIAEDDVDDMIEVPNQLIADYKNLEQKIDKVIAKIIKKKRNKIKST